MRRLVGRTVAQQLMPAVKRFTAPFQYALRTGAGTECVARILQALTEADPDAPVLSSDGVSAFDMVSRRAMLAAREVIRSCLRSIVLWPSIEVPLGG